MFRPVLLLFGSVRAALHSRADLVIENLALRQQLAVLARSGRRGRVTGADRLFWVTLRRLWARWSDVLVFVKSETVIQWHRAASASTGLGFRELGTRSAVHQYCPARTDLRPRRDLQWPGPLNRDGTRSAPGEDGLQKPLEERHRRALGRSVRSELFDRAVIFNERHLRRLLGEYVAYYHGDRTHYALEKETPGGRLLSSFRRH